jgi:hypothetical protein
MRILIFAMRVLEVLFLTGMAGSVVVILISFYEDATELFGKDEESPGVADRAREA